MQESRCIKPYPVMPYLELLRRISRDTFISSNTEICTQHIDKTMGGEGGGRERERYVVCINTEKKRIIYFRYLSYVVGI